jgi:hypothetical protein
MTVWIMVPRIEPFLQRGDGVLIARAAYRERAPRVGETVLFGGPNIGFIGAGPGQEIGGKTEGISLLMIAHDREFAAIQEAIREKLPFPIPEDCYLVWHHFPKGMEHQTSWLVTRDKIVGKAILIYYPFCRRRFLP